MGGDRNIEDLREYDRQWRQDFTDALKENTRLTRETQILLAEHCAGEKATIDKLEELRSTVYGNGKPGMKQDLTIIKWVLGVLGLFFITLLPSFAEKIWRVFTGRQP